jgi:choline-sulfatase
VAAVESRDDETVIVFTSDHGEGAARHKRTEKNSPYEEALKVPLIFVDPQCTRRGVLDRDNLVSGLDLVPTLCAYAGIAPPPRCRGESLRGLMTGESARKRRNFVFAELKQTVRIVRHGDHKYVKFYRHSGQRERPFVRKSDGAAEKFQPGRASDRYVDTGLALLFDLRRDPWENRNLIGEPAAAPVVARLEQLLADEFESVILPGTSYERP